jgi:hypothetical protein
MAIGLVKGESSLFLEIESTEGVYSAPSGASAAIEVLEDGLEFNYSRDEIERNTLTSTIESVAPRLGLKQITGSIPVEFKANGTAGEKPREHALYYSLLGGFRQIAAPVTSGTTHTSTVINIADTSMFNVGDVVLVKQAGAYEVRPISEITEDVSITFPFALENGAPSNAVEIEKVTMYFHDSPAPTISATHFLGGKIKEEVSGLRAISASLENWSTANVGTWGFSVEGLNLLRDVEQPAFSPDFTNDALPPVLLNACIWIDGVKVPYNEFSLSIENTKSELLSACSDSGKIGSRFTNLAVTGTFNPYMEDDDTDRFDSFNNNDSISIFGYAYNPTSVAGEKDGIIAFWMPQAKITEIPTGDQDGIITDAISFKAFRGNGNDTIFLGFI